MSLADLIAEHAAAMATIVRLAVLPRPLAFAHRDARVTSMLLVHPDVRRLPHWRVTYLDLALGPTGHVEADGGAAEALRLAHGLGADLATAREPEPPLDVDAELGARGVWVLGA